MDQIYNFYHNTLTGKNYVMMCIISSIVIVFCIIYYIVSIKKRIEVSEKINIDFSKIENQNKVTENVVVEQTSEPIEVETTVVEEEMQEDDIDFIEFNKNPLENIKDSKSNEGLDSAITSKEVLDNIVTTEVDEGGEGTL